jgi:hypothetical protein
MSSETAMNKYSGGVAKYRAAEGKTVVVAYRGPVENTVQSILGGVRSSCTYVGASHLKELSKRTTFIRVTQQVNQVYTGSEIPTPNYTAMRPTSSAGTNDTRVGLTPNGSHVLERSGRASPHLP